MGNIVRAEGPRENLHQGFSHELYDRPDRLLSDYNENMTPEEENNVVKRRALLEESMSMKILKYQDKKNHIAEVLAAIDLDCSSISLADTLVIGDYIEEILKHAISYHFWNTKCPEFRNRKLVISSQSLSYGLKIFQMDKNFVNDTFQLETNADSSKENDGGQPLTGNSESKTSSESKSKVEKSVPGVKKELQEVPPDNEFEKRIRSEVILPNQIGVTLADIGALDEVKNLLLELVVLPLQQPHLFKGELRKPCRGILLFGPPGTGKTMLAKAIASEAGANFINVSMSTITSKCFGEDEKNVLFTLAAKMSPAIIFVDEADSMLGQRTSNGEHEALRKIKNEFTTQWDRSGERILVLAATNRPFDLDEAVIRRFERRIMVDLPTLESREMILRTLLSKENVKDLDFKELSAKTEGYTGSDLKNLCRTAACQPAVELIKAKAGMKDMERMKREKAGKSSEDASDTKEGKEESKEERVTELRPLNMDDLRQAKNQVAASFASEGVVMSELSRWNEQYGDGASRKKRRLTYYS